MFPVVKLIKSKICTRSEYWDGFDYLTFRRNDSSTKNNCSRDGINSLCLFCPYAVVYTYCILTNFCASTEIRPAH